MKAQSKIKFADRRLNGSALLVSLMVMAVTTLGVASWLAIINGRTTYTEAIEDGMRRRVALENSRSIAEEYLYRVAATSDNAPAASFPANPSALPDPNPPFDADQPDIVEQVQIAGNTALPTGGDYHRPNQSRQPARNGRGRRLLSNFFQCRAG